MTSSFRQVDCRACEQAYEDGLAIELLPGSDVACRYGTECTYKQSCGNPHEPKLGRTCHNVFHGICAKPGCPYEHYVYLDDTLADMERCSFWDRCTNAECMMRHPPDSTLDSRKKLAAMRSIGMGKLIKTDCKFGSDCTRVDCWFAHPKSKKTKPSPLLCKYFQDDTCDKGHACGYTHKLYCEIPCVYEARGACTRANCKYKHVTELAESLFKMDL